MATMLCMKKEKQICFRTYSEVKDGFDDAVDSLAGQVYNLSGGAVQPGQLVEWFAMWFQRLSLENRVKFARQVKSAYLAWLGEDSNKN